MQAASTEGTASDIASPATPTGTVSSFWRTARNNVRLLQQSPPIQIVPRHQLLPLSFNQERIWRLERLQPESSVHNILHSFQLVGALNIPVLEQSLQEIAHRHEILRTTFPAIDGQPTQRIAAKIVVPVVMVDLCHLPSATQAIAVQKQAISQAEQPFDLEQGPLWRVALLKLSDHEYILLRTIHHIIFDGVSHSVFVRELGALYSALIKGETSPLIDLPVQYADFAWTQRQWLQGDILATQLGFWQQYFTGNVAPLELPTDFPRAAATSYRGAYASSILPAELTDALRALSARSGVSLFVTLYAAFNTLLHQYTGQEDIVVCSPVSGRHRAETRGLIGYFNNMVALRQDLAADPSFNELLTRVSQNFMEASNYQDVPLQLVAELPNLVRLPLTRAMFVLQNAPIPVLELEGLHVSSVYVDREVANFDLSLSTYEKAGQLTAVLQYKVDLFRPETITQMLAQYIDLLAHLVANPDQHLSDLPAFKRPVVQIDSSTQKGNSAALSDAQPVQPRNNVEQALTSLWEAVFRTQPIGVTDNFFDLGGHSLLAVQILTGIENQFGKKLPIATLLQSPTITALAEIIEQVDANAIVDDLVPLKRGGNKPPLFCLYGILLYQYLASHLDADQPVYGVYLREEVELLQTGRIDQLKTTFSDVQTVAARYLQVIQKHQPHGPYYLCGESFGGVIAYEMAQQLQAIGEEVALVAMFDSLSADGYRQSQLTLMARLEKHRQLILKEGLGYFYSKIERYTHIVQQKLLTNIVKLYRQLHPVLATLASKLHWQQSLEQFDQWLNGSTEEVLTTATDEAHDDIRSQVRHQMLTTYNPQPYFGKLLLFRATERDTFEAAGYDLGWAKVAGEDFHILDVPGDHLSILENPHVQNLAYQLQAHINGTQSGIAPEGGMARG